MEGCLIDIEVTENWEESKKNEYMKYQLRSSSEGGTKTLPKDLRSVSICYLYFSDLVI